MYPMILTIKEAICKILAVVLLLPSGYCLSDSNNTITAANPYESIENPYIVEYLNPDIAAHRSGAGNAPQNTLMAFENIIENGDDCCVDTLEFDVQITADGELVLQHDLTYDNTSNAAEAFGKKNVYVSSLTLEEAQVLNLGENFEVDGEYPYRGLRGDEIPENLRVVTCDSIIDYVEANCGDKKYNYLIEVKSIGADGKRAVDKLYSIISERNLTDRTVWSTFAPDVSSYMKSDYPEMPRTADAIEAVGFYLYFALGMDLKEANPSYVALQIPYGGMINDFIDLGSEEMLSYAHSYNIAVQYWTINEEEDVKRLTENGADCIITDYPEMAYSVIEECKKQ